MMRLLILLLVWTLKYESSSSRESAFDPLAFKTFSCLIYIGLIKISTFSTHAYSVTRSIYEYFVRTQQKFRHDSLFQLTPRLQQCLFPFSFLQIQFPPRQRFEARRRNLVSGIFQHLLNLRHAWSNRLAENLLFLFVLFFGHFGLLFFNKFLFQFAHVPIFFDLFL